MALNEILMITPGDEHVAHLIKFITDDSVRGITKKLQDTPS